MGNPDEPSPASDPHIGRTLGGKWRLRRLIAVGGMASVYAASHRSGTPAAVKVLHPSFARSPEARDRFMREGYIANAAGPGAVRILDDDIDEDGAPYLVMELLSGDAVDLRAERLGGRLPLRDVLWLASETLSTLAVAHANGILHRDLKPANLFWTDDDTIKLLDFGVARLRTEGTDHTSAGTIMGTPGYMAPEQARGIPEDMDARTDIWSVGAIMFRLLTGEAVHPDEGGSRLVAAATVQARSLGYVDPKIPLDVVAIVDRALAFLPEERFPNAVAMREAIVQVAGADDLRPGPVRGRKPALPPRAALASAIAPRNREVSIAELSPDDVVLDDAPPEDVVAAPAPGLATGMSDADTLALRALLELLEIATLSRADLEARDHPRFREAAKLGAFRRLEAAHKHATEVLSKAHIGLFWNVLPEGFATRQGLLWIARPPLPPTPARMYADGVRMLGLLPGIDIEELGEIIRIVRGELAPFHDFAALLHASHLPHLVHRIDATKPGVPEHPALSIENSLSGNVDVLAMVRSLEGSDPALRAVLFTRLERVAAGHEHDIGAEIPGAEIEIALGLLKVLAATGTDAAKAAMQQAAASPSPVVRLDAISLLDPSGDRLRAAVRDELSAGESAARAAVLTALEVYRLKEAAPVLVSRVRTGAFDRLPYEERRQTLATLAALVPQRAESLAVELLLDQRVISAPQHEATRELACELLGRTARSADARRALDGAATGRARTSDGVRTAAGAALEAFDSRVPMPSS